MTDSVHIPPFKCVLVGEDGIGRTTFVKCHLTDYSWASVTRGGEKDIVGSEDDPPKFISLICSKAFTQQRLLNRHMKCHSDLCTFCGKGFNVTFDLKRHTRTHTGVWPYKCNLCEKSFTRRCSLESHCLRVHGVRHQYAYNERRTMMYVCEERGPTTSEPEVHYHHLKHNHPYSPALLKFYDKRHLRTDSLLTIYFVCYNQFPSLSCEVSHMFFQSSAGR